MTSLDTRHYVATIADIAAITKAYNDGVTAMAAQGGTYLRALVATTQAAMGSKPRLRSAGNEDGPTLDGPAITAQLLSLEEVHTKFYETVLDNVTGDAQERNRRSGFARSAMSTVRAYVRSGHDLTLVAASRITKAALREAVGPSKKPRKTSVSVMRRRAARALDMLDKIGTAMARADKEAAVEVLEAAVAQLESRLRALGGQRPVTTDAKRAVREGRPLKTKAGIFHPVPAAH